MGTFSVQQIYDIYTRRPTSNIFRITVIKQVMWDRISRLRMICPTDLNTHASQTHHADCALGVSVLNAQIRIFLDLKPVTRFYIT